jgi:endonuclease/exonuclease/phosphatase family metal-dependent hydrolase
LKTVKLISFVFVLFNLTPISRTLELTGQIKLVNLNLRYNNPNDGENAWPIRKSTTISWLLAQHADIYLFQEVLHDQLIHLDSALSNCDVYGIGREDGKTKGEFSPIYFNRDRFHLVSGKTIWLSPTPTLPSKGWDAACERIFTLVLLVDQVSKDTLAIGNTHWDHVGIHARNNSAEIILNELQQLNAHIPILLGGDFNCSISDSALQKIHGRLTPAGNQELWSTPSYHGFGTSNSEACIDFVFYNNRWKNISFHTTTFFDQGKKETKKYISDHNGFVFEFEPRIFE